MNNNVFNLQYFDNNISEMERVLDNELKISSLYKGFRSQC